MRAMTPGTVVDRYRIEEVIGGGAMGDVVRALDVELKRPVALKILSQRHRDNEELRARFVREGRAVAAISHPNVVQVFTTGTFDDRPYIAMEYLRGVDLGSVVRERGTMSSRDAARAGHDAALGLEAAARAGLIHRDVKPSNLMLTEDGVVKVTDFGLAKPLDPKVEPALTAMGVVVGTPDYIAPEQARGDNIDERVDIYALGGTLYFLLTGNPPFRTGISEEDKYLKVVARHLKDPAPDARVLNPSVDAELAQVITDMMAKKPVSRPSHAELSEQFSSIAYRLQGARPRPSQRVDVPPAEPTPFVGGRTRLTEQIDRTLPPTERRQPLPWLLVVTGFSVLFFLVGAGLLLFGRESDIPTPGIHVTSPPPVREDASDTPVVKQAVAPPKGMVHVTHSGGNVVFCAEQVVHWSDFASVFPERKVPRGKSREAVAPVAFDFAAAYASAKGARLPTPAEWTACRGNPSFQAAGQDLLEWVDDGVRGAQAPRTVMRGAESAKRQPTGHDDVTFRVVASP